MRIAAYLATAALAAALVPAPLAPRRRRGAATRLRSAVGDVDSGPTLDEIVRLSAQPLPNRPDGVCAVVGYYSLAQDTGADEELARLSEKHPDVIFLRCLLEFAGGEGLAAERGITQTPTFVVYHREIQVARIDGLQMNDLEMQVCATAQRLPLLLLRLLCYGHYCY